MEPKCVCGRRKGDRMIVTGDAAKFFHLISPGTEVTLKYSQFWEGKQQHGWHVTHVASGTWDVSCVDLEPVMEPVTDDEVSEAIESILKGT